jgi:hypothetical protein
MALVKRWWVFVLFGIIVGLGILYWRGLNSGGVNTKTADKAALLNQKGEVMAGKKLVPFEKQMIGEVVSWNSSVAELSFKLDGGEEVSKVMVDPENIGIFIPEAQHRTQAVLPVKKDDKNWPTAFCPGDTLTVGYDNEGAVRLLFNTGYRMCGFRGN